MHQYIFPIGLWWHHTGTWWYHGQIRLSVLDGYICTCLSLELHQVMWLVFHKFFLIKILNYTLPHKRVTFISSNCCNWRLLDNLPICDKLWNHEIVPIYFNRAASPAKLVQQVLAMKPEEQLQVFNMLKDSLTKRGLLAIQWPVTMRIEMSLLRMLFIAVNHNLCNNCNWWRTNGFN